MSASVDTSAIFLTDTPSQIKNKINNYAFSGGQETAEKQRELGGRTKDDVAFQYLTFFMEDDAELEGIRQRYEKGEMLTGVLKGICIRYLQEYVAGFQERRKKVTEELRREFMTVRPLTWGGNPNPNPLAVEVGEKTGKEKEKGKEKKGKLNGEVAS